jgi:hypothetical protein
VTTPESRPRRSIRQSAVQAARRLLGTETLENRQAEVEQSLDALGTRAAELSAVGAEAAFRLDALERDTAALARDRQALQRALEDLRRDREMLVRDLERMQRKLEIYTFDSWLALEQPQTDVLVSVITATRNRRDLLAAAIASVRSQRHTMWELIVVDDGSTDDTASMLAGIDDTRIRSVSSEHVGVCAARNRAIDAATGEIVCYLDDDNLMHPGWLQAVAWAFSAKPEYDVLYGARVIDDWDAVTTTQREHGLPLLHLEPFDREALAINNLCDMNVIAHRRSHPEAHFDEDLNECGDWELFARLTADRDPLELPAIACVYRTTASGRLSDRPRELAAAEFELVRAKIAARAAERGGVARVLTDR